MTAQSLWRVEFTLNARNDLVNLYDALVEEIEEPEIALRVVKNLRLRALKLTDFPYAHRRVPTERFTEHDIRFTASGNYLALFRIDEDAHTVQVLRFVHTKRDLDAVEISA